MEKRQRPEKERGNRKTNEKEDIPENGVMMEIDNIVLNSRRFSSIYSNNDTYQCRTETCH
jgi:hypothetical protein